MFLLIRKSVLVIDTPEHFTFHNVSINTVEGSKHVVYDKALHSTMFLLIRKDAKKAPER